MAEGFGASWNRGERSAFSRLLVREGFQLKS